MTEEFIPCTPMALPDSLVEAASDTAITENPANKVVSPAPSSGIILSPLHLAFQTSKYWSNAGVRLTVGFMETTPLDLQKRILAHMNAWDEFCNANFVLTNTDPKVRITRAGSGYWSYLGSDILHIPRNQATMCLQGFTMSTPESEFRRVVRHETGHTLGCPHEHMRREIVSRLDPQKTIAYFQQTQGWSAAMTQQQVLTPIEESALLGTPRADEESIMSYQLPGAITRDGRPIVGGNDFSASDKEFAAHVYPEVVAPKPPPGPDKPLVGDFRMVQDFARKIVTIGLPTGWTVSKMNALTGETIMAECDRSPSMLLPYAAELESALGPLATPEGVAAAPAGGVVSKVWALITAIKSGDFLAIANAVYDLLGVLLGKTGGDGTIGFAQAEAAKFNLNWDKLIAILLKILPLILGAS